MDENVTEKIKTANGFIISGDIEAASNALIKAEEAIKTLTHIDDAELSSLRAELEKTLDLAASSLRGIEAAGARLAEIFKSTSHMSSYDSSGNQTESSISDRVLKRV